MRTIIALALASMSGLLVCFASALVLVEPGQKGDAGTVVGPFVIAWGLTAYWLFDCDRIGRMFRRAIILWAVEFLALIPAGCVIASKAVVHTVDKAGGTDPAKAGAVIGGGLGMAFFTTAAVGGCAACLFLYLVFWIFDRETAEPGRPDVSGTRACPACAEPIQRAALKCKHCQSDVKPMR